jgi:hypothetical protein
MICTSVKRLFPTFSAPYQIRRTLYHSDGTSGGEVNAKSLRDRRRIKETSGWAKTNDGVA